MSDASSLPGKRPSQRQIAERAGVSAMTVSLALRNHTSIPEATRERVQRIAAEAGYLPDPVIGKLMQQLRIRGRKRASVSLCVLAQPGVRKSLSYGDYIVLGARKAAEDLGYIFDVVELDESQTSPERLRRLLHNRGVEGLLLTPMMPPKDLSPLLDWRHFSIVASSTSVLGPRVHRVLPDQFGNMLLLCQRLHDLGYRRLGLVMGRDQDERTGHRIDGALSWYNRTHGVTDLPTLLCEDLPPPRPVLMGWMDSHRPDVLISVSGGYLEFFCQSMPELEEFPMAAISILDRTSRFAGILENPTEVGEASVELLSSLFQHGERGLPDQARTTLIGGTYWQPEGCSVQRFAREGRPESVPASGRKRARRG